MNGGVIQVLRRHSTNSNWLIPFTFHPWRCPWIVTLVIAECFFLKFFADKGNSSVNWRLWNVNILCGEFTGFVSFNLSLVVLPCDVLYIFLNVLLRVARFVTCRITVQNCWLPLNAYDCFWIEIPWYISNSSRVYIFLWYEQPYGVWATSCVACTLSLTCHEDA